MRQEVLCHDSRNLLEVIQYGESWILLTLVRWAKPAELVIGFECDRRSRLATKTVINLNKLYLQVILRDRASVFENAWSMDALS